MVRQSRPGPLPAQILLTRPLAEARRFADLIRAACADPAADPVPEITIAPLLAPEFLTPDWPARDFTAVILTSATAVEALRRSGRADLLPKGLPAFCVGPRTADAARALGLAAVSADGDAEALFAHICQAAPRPPLLHLRGEETRGDLAAWLCAAGIETLSRVVYRQRPLSLTSEARALLTGQDPVLLPVFSPRSAATLAAELRALPRPAPLHLVAISQATAAAFAGYPFASVTIAAQPNGKDLLVALLGVMRAGGAAVQSG